VKEDERIVFATDTLNANQLACARKVLSASYVYDALRYCQALHYEAHSVAVAHGRQSQNFAAAAALIRLFVESRKDIAVPSYTQANADNAAFITSLNATWVEKQRAALGQLHTAFIEAADESEDSIPFVAVTKVLFNRSDVDGVFDELSSLLTTYVQVWPQRAQTGERLVLFEKLVTYFFQLWMLCALLSEISPKMQRKVSALVPGAGATATMSALWQAYYKLGFTVLQRMPPFNNTRIMAAGGGDGDALNPKGWLTLTNDVPYSEAARYYAVLYAVYSNVTLTTSTDPKHAFLLEPELRVLAFLEYVDTQNRAVVDDRFSITVACSSLYEALKAAVLSDVSASQLARDFGWITAVIKNPYETVSLPVLFKHVSERYADRIEQHLQRWLSECEADRDMRLQAWKTAIMDATNLLCTDSTLQCVSAYCGMRIPSWPVRLYTLAQDQALFRAPQLSADQRSDVAELFITQFVNELHATTEDARSAMPSEWSTALNSVIVAARERVLNSTYTAYRGAVSVLTASATPKQADVYARGALGSVLATGLLTKTSVAEAIQLFSNLAINATELAPYAGRAGEFATRKTEEATYMSTFKLDNLTKATEKHLRAIAAGQIAFTPERLEEDKRSIKTLTELFDMVRARNTAVFNADFVMRFGSDPAWPDYEQSISVSLATIRDFVLALARVYASEEQLVEVLRERLEDVVSYEALFVQLLDFFALGLGFTYPAEPERYIGVIPALLPAAPPPPAAAKGKAKRSRK
jgi:hypothetical protein